jgi:hypothetical protein
MSGERESGREVLESQASSLESHHRRRAVHKQYTSTGGRGAKCSLLLPVAARPMLQAHLAHLLALTAKLVIENVIHRRRASPCFRVSFRRFLKTSTPLYKNHLALPTSLARFSIIERQGINITRDFALMGLRQSILPPLGVRKPLKCLPFRRRRGWITRERGLQQFNTLFRKLGGEAF